MFDSDSLQTRFDDAVRQSIFDLTMLGDEIDPLVTGVVAVGAYTAAISTVMDVAVSVGVAAAAAGTVDPAAAADKVAFIVELLRKVNQLAAEGAHRYLHGDD